MSAGGCVGRCVLVKETHSQGVRGAYCEMVRTGFNGLSGNKASTFGGV